jgi:hypothetical protein
MIASRQSQRKRTDLMPTAAKLTAAILFGALMWCVSELIKALLLPESNLGYFSEWNMLIGAVIGWRVAGGRAGTTWLNAVVYGLTAAFGMAGAALFLHSLARMLARSYGRVYEGPVEALEDVVRIVLADANSLVSPAVLGALTIGGAVGGLLTEWVARNYR